MIIFGRRSVAGIISSLTSMVEDLQQHAAAKAKERDKHFEEAVKASKAAQEANDEISKANAAAERIGGLFS